MKQTKRVTELGTKLALDEKPPKPAEMNGWTSWKAFEESPHAYFARFYNPGMGVPLSYASQTHKEVTEELLLGHYPTMDDGIIATTELTGDQYAEDSQKM